MFDKLSLYIFKVAYYNFIFFIKPLRVFDILQIKGTLVVCVYRTLNSMKSALLEFVTLYHV